MPNHQIHEKKSCEHNPITLTFKDIDNWPPHSRISLSSISDLITNKNSPSFSAKELLHYFWVKINGSSLFLLIIYCLLVITLTSLGLFFYSKVVDFNGLSLQLTTNIIYIFIWAALLSLPIISLLIINRWKAYNRYKSVKSLSLLCWAQLEELCDYPLKVQKACQANETPECSTLIKCLDNYYEKYTAFHAEMRKINLFIDDHTFDHLMQQYELVSQNFRLTLNDLIISMNHHNLKQEPCIQLIENLLAVTENMSHYHQLLSKALIRIMRY